jgi:hypothetical protein
MTVFAQKNLPLQTKIEFSILNFYENSIKWNPADRQPAHR